MSYLGALSSSRAKLWSRRLTSQDADLLDDSLVDESGMLLSTTEHVAHVFHWHFLKEFAEKYIN